MLPSSESCREIHRRNTVFYRRTNNVKLHSRNEKSASMSLPCHARYKPYDLHYLGRGSGVRRTSARGKTDHRLSGPNQRCFMLEYIIATFVLICSSRAGHMVGIAGAVSELFAKMLLFYKTMLCERSEDRKSLVLNEHCCIFICIGL